MRCEMKSTPPTLGNRIIIKKSETRPIDQFHRGFNFEYLLIPINMSAGKIAIST